MGVSSSRPTYGAAHLAEFLRKVCDTVQMVWLRGIGLGVLVTLLVGGALFLFGNSVGVISMRPDPAEWLPDWAVFFIALAFVCSPFVGIAAGMWYVASTRSARVSSARETR